MIVFTVLNSITQQYYVGIATECSEDRWQKFVAASVHNIDAPIYHDLKEHGADNFQLSDYAESSDREELGELVREAMIEYNALSLQGVKTSAPVLAEVSSKKKTTAQKTTTKSAKPAKTEKIATGRTTSTKKEKAIREAIAKEKADREQQKLSQIAAEADEMKAIMARLDARSASAKTRR